MYRPMLRPRGLGAVPAWQQKLKAALEQGIQRADPQVAEVVALAQEIIAMERRPGGALDPSTPSTFQIADMRKPMRYYLYYRRHPAIAYAIPIGILLLSFLLGRATVSRSPKRES